ncbi:hypothetical protein AXF42_Ash012121 [Apostasia shenzhenica]|uniref:Uncharacterized protein n=1 Tax=Apostasia shenzhenica TaxID=1088818 RepID=A0A2I0B423_9ASPA|nr:hypothetical protein AXF42_Ash012121 [Apostasia shenzhenica]
MLRTSKTWSVFCPHARWAENSTVGNLARPSFTASGRVPAPTALLLIRGSSLLFQSGASRVEISGRSGKRRLLGCGGPDLISSSLSLNLGKETEAQLILSLCVHPCCEGDFLVYYEYLFRILKGKRTSVYVVSEVLLNSQRSIHLPLVGQGDGLYYNIACHIMQERKIENGSLGFWWGAAYCVKGGIEMERVAMQYLERRECEYDKKALVDFYKEGEDLEPALTGVLLFISTPDKVANRYYLGPAPMEKMARQIATASGPCGNNREYLFSLEKAMFDIGHQDDYVIRLANEVRKVLSTTTGLAKDQRAAAPHVSVKPKLPLVRIAPFPETTLVDSR